MSTILMTLMMNILNLEIVHQVKNLINLYNNIYILLRKSYEWVMILRRSVKILSLIYEFVL